MRRLLNVMIRWIVYLHSSGFVVAASLSVDDSGYRPESGVRFTRDDTSLRLAWSVGDGRHEAHLAVNLRSDQPVIQVLELADVPTNTRRPLLNDVHPAFWITVGSRVTPPGIPDGDKWRVFFDNPVQRHHQTFASSVELRKVDVSSHGRSTSLDVHELVCGEFRGRLRLTAYAESPLVRVDAIVSTHEDRRAIVYDAGLLGVNSGWRTCAWLDTRDQWQRIAISASEEQSPLGNGLDHHLAVRHRAIIAETSGGSIACFPPPHQFFFPRDWTDNLKNVWYGHAHAELADRFGIGIRQSKDGGGPFVPWFNAPPEDQHRLGMFLLLWPEPAQGTMRQVLKFTRGDRFAELPGYLTMTSHWHMAIAEATLKQRESGAAPTVPELVGVFKRLGVNLVHLGEFHGDGHQRDPGPLRLPELATMFSECRRLSDDQLLLIPGEEINQFLGLPAPERHPGHWMSLFPKPVYWTMVPEDERPFVEEHATYGRVYHVGRRADMIRLIKEENGLVWAAHPRIKASSWTPDIFRHEDFFLADYWLGAAWKAMPADLSRPKLGEAPLEVFSNMANWGNKKYMLGEVDVFKIDSTHELFGHMNVNYVRLPRVPRFDEGWQFVLDALRSGQFFVTTGEVLITDFQIDGKESGETLQLGRSGTATLRFDVQWTFPLNFAQIVTGDGRQVYRQTIDLSDTTAHGTRTVSVPVDLTDRYWVRLEVWDAAANGAFTQPVWVEGDK